MQIRRVLMATGDEIAASTLGRACRRWSSRAAGDGIFGRKILGERFAAG